MTKQSLIKTTFKQKIALIAFGLFLGIVLLEIGLRIGGAVILHLQEQSNLASLKEKGEFVIMCLGESTTAVGGNNAYPAQLERILNGLGAGITFSVINKGIPGTNTTVIADFLEENLDRYRPDLVLAMIGINDRNYLWSFKDISLSPFHRFIRNLRVYKLARLLYQHTALTLGYADPRVFPGDADHIRAGPQAAEPMADFSERRTALEKRTRIAS